MEQPKLAILIPCFNESDALPLTCKILTENLAALIQQGEIHQESFLYFIDDGSHDETWNIITELRNKDFSIKALKLSRNFGQQNAIYAGLMHIKDKIDCAISIDADLQDSPKAIKDFITRYKEGFEIVYGVRKNRNHDGFFKKTSASFFYKIMKVFNSKIIPNHSDFRLVSNRAITHLEKFSEFNLFLRGVITLIGFRSCSVYYDRAARIAGKSKYSFTKLLAYSVNGITAFSIVPLRILTGVGILCFLGSLSFCITILLKAWLLHSPVPPWELTVLPIYFLGGIQLLTLGIFGEYLGKVYQEIKARPKFIVDTELQ